MELMHIPLSELAIAKVNVRHGVKKADYKDLIPSIKERGILQPLLVRKNGRGYEIIAGRRPSGLLSIISVLCGNYCGRSREEFRSTNIAIFRQLFPRQSSSRLQAQEIHPPLRVPCSSRRNSQIAKTA